MPPSTGVVRPLPAVALVACLFLSGCFGGTDTPEDEESPQVLAPLSEPTFGYGEFLSLTVPSYDGTPLHVDVQLPQGDGPWPLVIEYTPYVLLGDEETWGAQKDLGQEASQGMVDFYVPRGYAFGVAHVRGLVPGPDHRTHRLEARRDVRHLLVRPAHLVAEVHQQLRDAAHPDAADADEVDAPRLTEHGTLPRPRTRLPS